MKEKYESEYRKLGNRIRFIRNERGMTQKEVADHIDINQRQISQVERGSIGLSFDRILDFCNALGVTPMELMDYESRIRK